jgi:hypothetical protein
MACGIIRSHLVAPQSPPQEVAQPDGAGTCAEGEPLGPSWNLAAATLSADC